jgi:hypothetical protein
VKRLWFKFEMRRAILDGKKTSTTREHPLFFGEHLAVSGSRFHAKPFAVLEIRDRFPTTVQNVITMFYKEEGFTSPDDMRDFLKRNKLLTNDVPVYFHVFKVLKTLESPDFPLFRVMRQVLKME